jgi:hypothetical protein
MVVGVVVVVVLIPMLVLYLYICLGGFAGSREGGSHRQSGKVLVERKRRKEE